MTFSDDKLSHIAKKEFKDLTNKEKYYLQQLYDYFNESEKPNKVFFCLPNIKMMYNIVKKLEE